MSHSPARRHLIRVQAEEAARNAPAGEEVVGGAYELMLAQLHEHTRTLKGIQSVERKIAAKREFLAVYDDYLDGALAGGHAARDRVLTTLLVWNFDCGSWDRGLQLAEHALAHDLPLPDQYSRDLPTLLIDETASAVLVGKLTGDDARRVLARVQELTADRDAPDQARAKLHKAIAYALMGKAPGAEPDLDQLDATRAALALRELQRAHELFQGVGVKKDMERLERRAKGAEPAAASA